MTERQHTRAERSDKGSVRGTERDLVLLRWVAQQYAISLDQLTQLVGASEHAGRRLMQRWKQAGWAEGRVLLVRQPPVIWVTRKGQTNVGTNYRPWEPALARLDHIFAVNQVRIMLEQRRPDGIWTSERDLLQAQASKQRSARSVGLVVPPSQHMADGVWEPEPGADQVAIEVERTYKGTERTTQIMHHLIQVQRYPKVAYFTTPTIKAHLDRIIASTAVLAERIRVYLIEEQSDEQAHGNTRS
jgi:hypothetical protein